jgi:hypothetical protein
MRKGTDPDAFEKALFPVCTCLGRAMGIAGVRLTGI